MKRKSTLLLLLRGLVRTAGKGRGGLRAGGMRRMGLGIERAGGLVFLPRLGGLGFGKSLWLLGALWRWRGLVWVVGLSWVALAEGLSLEREMGEFALAGQPVELR